MQFALLLNRILRLPFDKANELREEYQEKVGFKNLYEQQRVFDILMNKANIQKQIKEEAFMEMYISLVFMTEEHSMFGEAALENIKDYPIILWIECIGKLDPERIMLLLKNYHKKLLTSIIETCIINLPEDLQVEAIDRYQNQLDQNSMMFSNFYYSVDEKARIKLKEYFKDKIGDDILLELQDLEEDIVFEKLESEHERLLKLPIDDLIELILLKSQNLDTLNRFFKKFSKRINEGSSSKFQLLLTRYQYLKNNRDYDYDDEKPNERLTDSDLFKLFKDKFHQIGIEETLSLFDHRTYHKSNPFTEDVVLEFLDIAYSDSDLSKYMNDETLSETITRFVEQCNLKEYSIEEFEQLVKSIKTDGRTKLIFDDYIEAIITCGKLLRNQTINNQHPLFLELRSKFENDLLSRCQKDGTYLENISLSGVFYRLAKGSIPFEKVYMTKTYKGLIYLSKCGKSIDNADDITQFLSDEQLVKLNITPALRWKNTINRTNTNADSLFLVERMGLQLLLFFGRDKGKYLLESNIQGNRMENLFDGLQYENISIKENGEPITNQELIDYLFGRGKMREKNSVMNKMIRGEIPEFEKFFIEFCNSFEEVKETWNGVLSISRIVKHFEDIGLPIELKPDEVGFKHALVEMNTTNQKWLSEAIELCKDARNRGYSSIPKVEGKLGDFVYKILDLSDPMAVCVGYLSHCCFTVGGASYSALKHSMQSKNGRTFVVYYQGQFLTQSWVWRNGDVICFDSVEAGSTRHGMYEDDIKLVDVYKEVAHQMLYTSQSVEDDIQKVKVVTVGKSDYVFEDLEMVEMNTPKPLEDNVYVYDSNTQYILVGEMPKNPRYGTVGVQYQDPRKKAITINDISNTSIDTLDEIVPNINSLRYQINKEESILDYTNYKKMISGDGWYILIKNDGLIESGYLDGNEEVKKEYNQYLSKYQKLNSLNEEESFVKRIKPLSQNKDRR